MTLAADQTANQSKERSLEFTRSVLILVEGWADQRLTAVLLESLLIGDRAQVHCMKGKDTDWSGIVGFALKDPTFSRNGTAIGLVRDADGDPAAAAGACRGILRANELPSPATTGVETGGGFRGGVYILPSPASEGTVEHLIWDAVDSKRRELAEQFAVSVETEVARFKYPMKNRLLAYLAAQENHVETLPSAIERPQVVPRDSDSFAEFKSFLLELVAQEPASSDER